MLTSKRVPLRSGRGLVVLFCATILLPGVLLAVFGVRALMQERRFATQQLLDRLDLAAANAGRDLDRAITQWQTLLDQWRRGEQLKMEDQPARVRDSLADAGAAAIVFRRNGQIGIWPRQQPLYDLSPPVVVGTVLPSSLTEAESAEIQAKDYRRAERLYRDALASAQGSVRAETLHRLARTLRKIGRDDEAKNLYHELAASRDRIGILPAELIARYEVCSMLATENETQLLAHSAFDFYSDLVAGQWALEHSRYEFYATKSREWASTDVALHEGLARVMTTERRKRELVEAASSLLETTQSDGAPLGTYLVFRTTGDAAAGLLLSKRWLADHLWPEMFAPALSEGLDVELVSGGADVLFRSASAAPTYAPGLSARTADLLRMPWRVRVFPHDQAAFSAELARRQTIYLVMLGFVVALLVFGTYLTARVVNQELEIARLKSDFVSAVSHEFRSPLTGIRQLGEMLMRGRVTSEERRQEYYERITRESDRLSRLVENLLDFSRMEDGRREYRFEQLETAGWLRSLIDDARSQHPDRQIAIVANIPDSLPPLIADETALACAVHNLIDNAVKYSPGRESVWVDAESRNGRITIRVHDAGVGITDDERQHIFQKFYRGRGEITRHVKGAGLGLSLVERIVSAHRGTVECEGRAGQGTTFSIQLPMNPQIRA